MVSRLLHTNGKFEHKFICTSRVEPNNGEEDEHCAMHNYETRKKYYSLAAAERQIISDELTESNIKNITLFSFIFELFNSNHEHDMLKFKLHDFVRDEHGLEIKVKPDSQSSFILYNCARLHAILEKFQLTVEQGLLKKIYLIEILFYFINIKIKVDIKI